MAVRAQTGFRLHPRFVEALRSVPQDVYGQATKLVEQVARDPRATRQLKGCKKVKGAAANVFEARVDRDWRVIFLVQPNGEPYLLLLGTHDDVFRSARRLPELQLDSAPAIAFPVVEQPANARANRVSERAPFAAYDESASELNLPFSRVPDALFDFWGVDGPVRAVIRTLAHENDLTGLIGELPDAVIETILGYLGTGTIRRPGAAEEATAAEVLLAAASGTRTDRDDGGAGSPLGLTRELLVEIEVPDSLIDSILAATNTDEISSLSLPLLVGQRLFEAITVPPITGVAADAVVDSYASSVSDIDDYYRGSITKLLLNLQPAQRGIVDLPSQAVHFIKGVAGSGKTTVALYRARRLLREDSAASVLFLTYNKSLAQTAAELASALMPDGEASRLEVVNFDRWMHRFLDEHGSAPTILKAADRERLVKRSIAEVRKRDQSKVLDRPAQWFLDEISNLIKGRGLRSIDDYLAVDRVGRTTALAEPARRAVWSVYEAYQKGLEKAADWDDPPLQCLEILSTNAARRKPYAHVIVDEAQDLSPVRLRLALALSGQEQPSALLVADAAQSIYRSGFRWKDIGLALHGSRVHHLRNNYRNTFEILQLTNAFISKFPELREDGESGALDDNTPRRGPLPTVVVCNGAKAEATAIARRIHWLRKHKSVPFANIAVAARSRARLEYIAHILRESSISAALYADTGFTITSDCVKLTTLHSAKGLEFPVVFIADVNAGVLPRSADDQGDAEDELNAERRLMYVGMTRAMQELYITTTEGRESPFIGELPTNLYQTVRSTADAAPVRSKSKAEQR